MKLSKNRGFTLVEIMIVVAIMGLLAAIAIPSFCKARNQAKMNRLGLDFYNGSPGSTKDYIAWDTKTSLAVEVDKEWDNIVRVTGILRFPDHTSFKKIADLAQMRTHVRLLTKEFLDKYPQKELLAYARKEKAPSQEFLQDLEAYRNLQPITPSGDSNTTKVKSVVSDTLPAKPYINVTADTLEINLRDSWTAHNPLFVIVNGQKYRSVSAIEESTTPVDGGRLQDDDKWKRIENTFKSDKKSIWD